MLLPDLGDYLSSQAGFTVATDLFLGKLPPSPDTAVAIHETGGQQTVHAFNALPGQAKVERPRVLVVSRALDYATARANAQKVFLLMDGFPTRTINGTSYRWGAAVQSPFLMGVDDRERPMVATSYDILKEMSTTS